MSLYEDSNIIVLNSSDATKNNGTMNSNLYWELNGLLKTDHTILMSHIQLITAQIPRSFYTINANNNKLFYTIVSIFSITIPVGNYNANSLITTMTSLFLANGHTITPVISRITGKITYTGTTNFTFNSTNSTILKILGFLPTINSSSTSNVLVSPFPLNLLGNKRIVVTSQKLATTAYITSSSRIQIESVLGTIDVTEPPYGMINNPNLGNVKHVLKVKNINGIDLQIKDEDGNLLDFNNQDWSMKLDLRSTYELVLDSKTTLKGLTEQQMLNPLPNNQPTNTEIFTQDSDLDLLLYNSKRPVLIQNPQK